MSRFPLVALVREHCEAQDADKDAGVMRGMCLVALDEACRSWQAVVVGDDVDDVAVALALGNLVYGLAEAAVACRFALPLPAPVEDLPDELKLASELEEAEGAAANVANRAQVAIRALLTGPSAVLTQAGAALLNACYAEADARKLNLNQILGEIHRARVEGREPYLDAFITPTRLLPRHVIYSSENSRVYSDGVVEVLSWKPTGENAVEYEGPQYSIEMEYDPLIAAPIRKHMFTVARSQIWLQGYWIDGEDVVLDGNGHEAGRCVFYYRMPWGDDEVSDLVARIATLIDKRAAAHMAAAKLDTMDTLKVPA